MPWLRMLLPLVVLIVSACGPAPLPSPSVSNGPVSSPSAAVASPSAAVAASTPDSSGSVVAVRELGAGSAPLDAGTYTRGGFRPPLTFTIAEGWTAGTVTDGFFDVQQEVGTPDVIAVQFAHVDGIAGAGAAIVPATTAAAAAAAIHENPGLTVVDESASRLGGLEGLTVVVENRGTAPASVMRVAPGMLSIDPGRKLWVSLFDTPDGLLAVMVGGSIARWDRALTVAEPVLESVAVAPG